MPGKGKPIPLSILKIHLLIRHVRLLLDRHAERLTRVLTIRHRDIEIGKSKVLGDIEIVAQRQGCRGVRVEMENPGSRGFHFKRQPVHRKDGDDIAGTHLAITIGVGIERLGMARSGHKARQERECRAERQARKRVHDKMVS